MAVKCVNWLETHVFEAYKQAEERYGGRIALSDMPNGGVYATSPETCAVIGVRGTNIVFTPVDVLLPEADLKKRVWKNPWWKGFSSLVRVLAKYGVKDEDEELLPFMVDISEKDESAGVI